LAGTTAGALEAGISQVRLCIDYAAPRIVRSTNARTLRPAIA
jgi:hypothetical protein